MIRHILIILALLGCSSPAVNFQELGTVKRLTADKRYLEAIQKLEALAAKTDEPVENFRYLDLGIDVAVKSLKDLECSLRLAEAVKGAGYCDFARLRVLAEFGRDDEALLLVPGGSLDDWPAQCRGRAHAMLAEIYHKKKDAAAELQQWLKAADSNGTEVGLQGRAWREAAVIYLRQGDAVKAEEYFGKAIVLTPSNYAWRIESLIGLSRLLIQNHRAKDAVEAFKGTDFGKIESLTSRGSLLEAYARALLASGKKIKAIEAFDQLLQLNLPPEWKDRINRELDQMAEDF